MNADRLASYAIVVAALALTVTTLHGEFGSPRSPEKDRLRPVYIDNWKEIARAGISLGDTSAKVQIVEFADFQCPACQFFEKTLRDVERRYGSAVNLVFVHWPLKPHKFASDAARAAECGNQQGRFVQMRDALYSDQEAFGKRSWVSYAVAASIPDTIAYSKCMATHASFPRIDAGLRFAEQLNLTGTPTVIINGWRFRGSPPDVAVSQTIDDLLRNEKPRFARRWYEAWF